MSLSARQFDGAIRARGKSRGSFCLREGGEEWRVGV